MWYGATSAGPEAGLGGDRSGHKGYGKGCCDEGKDVVNSGRKLWRPKGPA